MQDQSVQKEVCAWRWRAHLWKPTTTQGVLLRFTACRSATANFCTKAGSSVSAMINQSDNLHSPVAQPLRQQMGQPQRVAAGRAWPGPEKPVAQPMSTR